MLGFVFLVAVVGNAAPCPYAFVLPEKGPSSSASLIWEQVILNFFIMYIRLFVCVVCVCVGGRLDMHAWPMCRHQETIFHCVGSLLLPWEFQGPNSYPRFG